MNSRIKSLKFNHFHILCVQERNPPPPPPTLLVSLCEWPRASPRAGFIENALAAIFDLSSSPNCCLLAEIIIKLWTHRAEGVAALADVQNIRREL